MLKYHKVLLLFTLLAVLALGVSVLANLGSTFKNVIAVILLVVASLWVLDIPILIIYKLIKDKHLPGR